MAYIEDIIQDGNGAVSFTLNDPQVWNEETKTYDEKRDTIVKVSLDEEDLESIVRESPNLVYNLKKEPFEEFSSWKNEIDVEGLKLSAEKLGFSVPAYKSNVVSDLLETATPETFARWVAKAMTGSDFSRFIEVLQTEGPNLTEY